MPFMDIIELTALLEDKSWSLTYIQANAEPKSPLRNQIRFKNALKKNPIIILESENDLIRSMETENTVFFGIMDVATLPQKVSSYYKTLTIIRDDANLFEWVAFPFHKNMSGVRHKFDQALIEVMPFAQGHIKWKYYNSYPPNEDSYKTKLVRISFKHLSEALLLWICRLIPSVLAFFVEIWLHRVITYSLPVTQ